MTEPNPTLPNMEPERTHPELHKRDDRQLLVLNLYAAISCFACQAAHIIAYSTRGGTGLKTWTPIIIPIWVGLLGSALLLVVSIGVNAWLLRRFLQIHPERLAVSLTIYVLLMGSASQLVSSSLMRASYEISFYGVTAVGLYFYRFFTSDAALSLSPIGTTHSQRLWHLVRMVVPVSLAWPVAVLGLSMIRDFYPAEQDIMRAQLYRHMFMVLLTLLGLLLLVVAPVMNTIIRVETTQPISDQQSDNAPGRPESASSP